MTSKEALTTLFASYYYDGNYQQVIEAREKIEQDLERLEELEEAHKKLFLEYCKYKKRFEELNEVWHKNEPMECVDLNADHLQEEYDFIKRLCEENESLKRARDKLIKIVKNYSLKQDSLTDYLLQENFDLQQKNLELETKNAKLENAIKILKMQVDGCTISQQEDELVKEVLEASN